MNWLKQVGALCLVSFRAVPHRLGGYLVIVLGVAGVVAVLLSVLAISGSLVRAIAGSGRDDRAIIMNQGAVSENVSQLERHAGQRLQSVPMIRRGIDGRPLIVGEALAVMRVREAANRRRANVVIRGASSDVFAVRPELRIVDGRAMRPGFYEFVVGKRALDQFTGLKLGEVIQFRNIGWTVVGVFSSEGDAHEMEALTDVEMLLSATQRNAISSVTVRLESPDAFGPFERALAADPSLAVKTIRESAYYRQQSEPLKDAWSFVAYIVGGIMAIGATFGAANTMYSAMSARSVELATLRALGFDSNAVLFAVLIEAALFAVVGALLGAAIVWLLFNGHTFSTRLGFARMAAQLTLDARLVMLGVAWGCAISLLGALAPVLRSLRQPIARALRAS